MPFIINFVPILTYSGITAAAPVSSVAAAVRVSTAGGRGEACVCKEAGAVGKVGPAAADLAIAAAGMFAAASDRTAAAARESTAAAAA